MIRHTLRIRRHIAAAVSAAIVSVMLAPAAHASGSSMPGNARMFPNGN